MQSGDRRVRVLIATTSGPIEIEQIIELPETNPQSIVLVPRLRKKSAESSHEAQAREKEGLRLRVLSKEYDRFTAYGSGIIGNLYGHQRYRIDLSKLIDEGTSWQLGAFLAHALHNAGRLARKGERADTVVLATGKIRQDISITAIGFLDRKLDLAFDRLAAEASTGCRAMVMFPRANDKDVGSEREQNLKAIATLCAFDSTASALDAVDLEPVHVTNASDQPVGNPYRGLEPFNEEHQDIFFGRGAAIDETFEIIQREAARDCAFLLIYGRSGSGKSSLARAGLMPTIAQQAAAADDWRSLIIEPGSASPLARFAETIINTVPELALSTDNDALLQLLRRSPHEASELIAQIVQNFEPARRLKLILLVDQLEQLLAPDTEDRDRFGELIAHLARSGLVWVIATMRSDLLDLLDGAPSISALASPERMYRLRPPGLSALREIVTLPAKRAGIEFVGSDDESTKLEDLLIHKANRPDALPLLEFMLEKLYETEGAKTGRISFENYQRMGGLDGVIGRLAERAVEPFTHESKQEKTLDALILSLGRFDPETTNVTAASADLTPSSFEPWDEKILERILGALQNERLIVRDYATGAKGTYKSVRVTHEAVLNQWPRALRLFQWHQQEMALRDRLQYEAEDWRRKNSDDGHLIPDGARLREAQGFLSAARVPVSALVRDYVERSDAAGRRKRGIELQRQADLIAAQNAKIAAQQDRISTIRRGGAALVIILISAIVYVAYQNIVAGGNVFGPGPNWKARFDAELNMNVRTVVRLLNLAADARKDGDTVRAAALEKIVPLPPATKDKILSLLPVRPSEDEVRTLVPLSSAELDAKQSDPEWRFKHAMADQKVGESAMKALRISPDRVDELKKMPADIQKSAEELGKAIEDSPQHQKAGAALDSLDRPSGAAKP